MATVMKGSEVVNAMKTRMLAETEALKANGVIPCLAIVRLGARPDDLAYERGAMKRCEGVGIKCVVMEYPESISQDELVTHIEAINKDPAIHGVLLFRPLPKHIDEKVIKYAIRADKDVDCLNPINAAKVFEGDITGFAPCTPEAVMALLEYYHIDACGKRAVVIGRSLVVGKPLAMLLLKKNATVTLCHTRTKDIAQTCQSAEILIAAAGKAKMVTEQFVSPGQVVIDVGIHVDPEGSLCGDVDYHAVESLAASITPVPGGVGTVTSSILADHVIRAAKQLMLT